jgi:hypothetical protein
MRNKKKHRNVRYAGLTVCFTFFVQFIFCQTVQTITDKKDILIGEQIKLTLTAPLPLNAGGITKTLAVTDSIPHFEIVESGKVDTIDLGGNVPAIEQSFIITSFDSGRWVFPAVPVEFAVAGQSPETLMTDSFFVNVSYSPADSTNQLRDIKPIIKVSVFDFFWVYIAGGILVLLLIIFLLYRYFKKKKQTGFGDSNSNLSPFDEAMAELKNLSQFKLQDAAEIKLYHIKLAAIFKNYIGRKQGKNLFNKTAADLLINMKEVNLPAENISELATALRCTDAVKFAKYLPLPDQSEDALQKIKDTINLMEASKPLNPKPLN